MDILELLVDPSFIEGGTPECGKTPLYLSECLPFEAGWSSLHEIESQSDSDIANVSDVCVSDIFGSFGSQGNSSPTSISSASPYPELNYVEIPVSSQAILPEDVADFIETYNFQDQTNNNSNSKLKNIAIAESHMQNDSQWRKISMNLKPKLSPKRKPPESYNFTAKSKIMNYDKQLQAPIPVLSTTAPKSLNSSKVCMGKETNRRDRKKDSNRLSAYRYREKKKALSEDAKNELLNAVHQYKRAKSAYDKAFATFSEMEKLVLGILTLD